MLFSYGYLNPIIMEIRDFLQLHSSRVNADILADKIEEDPFVFEEVWEIMMEQEERIAMRAAWALTILAKKHPWFFDPVVPQIIEALQTIQIASVRRCLLNLLTRVSLQEDQAGFLFDLCFNILESPSAEIAHKAYAMTILYNISEMEPDLKPELIALFESQFDDESSAIKARARILQKELYKDLSLPPNEAID